MTEVIPLLIEMVIRTIVQVNDESSEQYTDSDGDDTTHGNLLW